MFRKAIVAAVAATVLAAGSLSLSASSASASGIATGGYVSGNGWSVGWGTPWWGGPWWGTPYPPKPPMKKVCQPTWETKKVWSKKHGWVWVKVYAGQKCFWQPVYPKYPKY